MKTLKQLLAAGVTGKIWLAKKGRKYVTIRNGELALTTRQRLAIAGKNKNVLDGMFCQLECDTHNAKFAPQGFISITVK